MAGLFFVLTSKKEDIFHVVSCHIGRNAIQRSHNHIDEGGVWDQDGYRGLLDICRTPLVMDPVDPKGKHEHASKDRDKCVSVDPASEDS